MSDLSDGEATEVVLAIIPANAGLQLTPPPMTPAPIKMDDQLA